MVETPGALTGFLCLGSIVLAPLFTFVIGFLIGRNRLPWTIKIERTQPKYDVEVGNGSQWQPPSNL